MWMLQTLDIKKLGHFTYSATDNYFVSAGGTTLLMRLYAKKQNWHHSQNSCREGICHCLVISLDLMQLSLHIKTCGAGRQYPSDVCLLPR